MLPSLSRARGSFPCPVPRGAQVGGSSFPLGPTEPQDEAAAPAVPQIPRGDESGGAPKPPRAQSRQLQRRQHSPDYL